MAPIALGFQCFFVKNPTNPGSGSLWEIDLNATLFQDNGHALLENYFAINCTSSPESELLCALFTTWFFVSSIGSKITYLRHLLH